MRIVSSHRNALRIAVAVAATAGALALSVGTGAGMSSTAVVRVRATGSGYVRVNARFGRSVRTLKVRNSLLRLRIGTRLTLVGRPLAPATFSGWHGACVRSGRRATCTLIVRHSGSVLASFASPPPLVVSSGGGGVGASIVSIAISQDQYHAAVRDNPIASECNPYTAYWGDGSPAGCAAGNSSVASGWCADFVAWVWRQAGVSFIYGPGDSDINVWTKSFYLWGVANGTWHPIGDGYVPQPGDAVLYGVDAEPSSSGHVGIYVSGPSTSPTVVNGNWAPNYPNDTTSGVYTESGQSSAAGQGGDLRGYVSP
jgi:hypothetical protein